LDIILLKEVAMPKREIIPGLAARLKEVRERADLTQQQAADAAGTYQATIGRFETEKRVPTLDQLYKLAKAYGVTVCALLPGGEAEPGKRRSK
jgi:transcriptional regulator with XRE-family HTH domain